MPGIGPELGEVSTALAHLAMALGQDGGGERAHGLALGQEDVDVGATALDAARLLHALLTGDLLPAELRATMTSGVAVGGAIAGRPWHVAC